MAKINLLPWREELREQRQKEFVTVLAVVAALGGAMVFGADRVVNSQIDYQHARNNMLSNEIAVLDKRVKEIKDLKKQKKELLERMRVIQDLQGNRPVIVRVFDELVQTLPEGVYFTSVSRKVDSLAVVGAAESNNRVSGLMRKFDHSEWLADPNLTSVSANPGFGPQANNFNMTVTLTTPESEEEEEGKGKKNKKPKGKKS